MIALKNYIRQIADTVVFEQNTSITRGSFLSRVNPYLDGIQQKQGLYAYKVVMDETNNGPAVIDQNQLVGQIYIKPTRTAEFISLDFILLPTGAEFPG
jgi:phage tail sheath protein FI